MLLWKVTITDDRRTAAEEIAASGGRDVTPEQVLASPYYQIGSANTIAERLLGLRERFGISHFSVFPNDAEAFAPVVARLKGR